MGDPEVYTGKRDTRSINGFMRALHELSIVQDQVLEDLEETEPTESPHGKTTSLVKVLSADEDVERIRRQHQLLHEMALSDPTRGDNRRWQHIMEIEAEYE